MLIALPLLLVLIPAWFLYETTIANLTGHGDDRSSGLKRWYAMSTPLLALAGALPGVAVRTASEHAIMAIIGLSGFFVYLVFCALLFGAEPAGSSRRVRVHWMRSGAGIVRRFFGPGLIKTMVLTLLVGFAGLAGIVLVQALLLHLHGATGSRDVALEQMLVFGVYAALFFFFVVGLMAWLRARGAHQSPWTPRLIAGAFLFIIAAGPWVVALIGGAMARHGEEWLVVAAPSPFYAYLMAAHVKGASSESVPILVAGLGCALAWGFLGFLLMALAARRCARTVAEHDAAVATAEAALAAEDERLARSAAPSLSRGAGDAAAPRRGVGCRTVS